MATEGEWEGVGRYVAKIIADVIGKSPIAETWTHLNSESIKQEVLVPKYNVKEKIKLA